MYPIIVLIRWLFQCRYGRSIRFLRFRRHEWEASSKMFAVSALAISAHIYSLWWSGPQPCCVRMPGHERFTPVFFLILVYTFCLKPLRLFTFIASLSGMICISVRSPCVLQFQCSQTVLLPNGVCQYFWLLYQTLQRSNRNTLKNTKIISTKRTL